MRHACLVALWLCLAPPAASQDVDALYQSACDADDFIACNVFGLMLETGQGASRDPPRALRLYVLACDGGALAGCTNAGLMYANGLAGPADPVRARDRYRYACEGGEPLACDLLDDLDAPRGDATPRLYTKTGRVADGSTARTLPEALVQIPELGIVAVTDDQGRVALGEMPAGRYLLTSARFGYEDTEGTLDVPGSAEFLVLMSPATIADPLAPSRIEGLVTDGREGLSDVEVSTVGRERGRAITDASGRFALGPFEAGLVQLRLSRLGYATRTASLVVQPGEHARPTVEMSVEAIELAPLEVRAEGRMGWLDRQGFYDRAERGYGLQAGPEDLDRVKPFFVFDIVRRAHGINVTDPYGSVPPTSVAYNDRLNTPGLGRCVLSLFIDGVLMVEPNLEQISVQDVAAIEVYTGNDTPARYRGANPCGVVLLWTKR